MTPVQVARAMALQRVSMLPGDPAKRFIRHLCQAMDHDADLSERQEAYLARLAWKFRRQLPGIVVPERKPV
jgi:hypothetical protein